MKPVGWCVFGISRLAIRDWFDSLGVMKLLNYTFAVVFGISGSLLHGAEIKWPKESFTVEKLADATAKATEEKKPVAYIVMFRGEKPDREARRNREKDEQDPSAAYELTEDLAKDCDKFAVVVNVLPADLQKDPSPFTEEVLASLSASLSLGTVPTVVIASPDGSKVFARGDSKEIQDDARKILREAKENHEAGKQMEYRKPNSGDDDEKKEERKEKDDDEDEEEDEDEDEDDK